MHLDSPLTKLPLVGPSYVKKLEKLDLLTVEDLLHHIPFRYLDYSNISKIKNIEEGATTTIQGKVDYIKNVYTKSRKKLQFAQVTDNTGTIDITWFNQPFLTRTIKKGGVFSFSGKVEIFNGKLSLISPDYEKDDGKDMIHTSRFVPVYPTTAGVSSKWLRSRINHALQILDEEFEEFLPKSVLEKNDLQSFKKSIRQIHFPDDLNLVDRSRKRLAFNEFLFLQLNNLYRKKLWTKNEPVHKLEVKKDIKERFTKALPFTLTKSQNKVINEVTADLKKDTPMNRLLEGDVGSGKTVIAASSAFVSFVNGYQSVFMAPTQILAHQHYTTLRTIFKDFKIRISLVTSAKIKSDLGKTDIFVGTHALIHKKVDFDKVAFVAIDEQQRFGVEQRSHLISKTKSGPVAPHVLTMTATPIPRTIALTLHGDLELSTLDELPKGRQKIITWTVPPKKREEAYKWIDEQIKKYKVQAYIICPLIEESEAETMKQVKAATAEHEKLCEIFPDLNVGLLHGKHKQKEKEEIMNNFKKGKINILVSTPVIEVGIDVPNATIMLIEAAERFGLSQLHQLRGRVGRGKKQSYCLLFTNILSKTVKTRLNALKQGFSGFELAELDLKLRGPGEVFGTRQHGFTELKIASWQEVSLNKLAKKVAEDSVKNRKKYQKLLQKLKTENIVFN